MNSSLREIHEKKSGKISDKWDIYLDIYEELLSKYRNKNINILEIGVQNGGSLETWGAYFKYAETIIGCDINTSCGNLHFNDERIRVVVGDATTEETAKEIDKLAQSFDIVIEDGSHTSHDIVATFVRLFPRLRPGGLYVAEDLHCCYWEEWGGGLGAPCSAIEYFKALCDCLNSSYWHRPGITQTGFIDKTGKHHGITTDDKLLDSIRSIEFYDSICVIRKADEGALARIKERIISGKEENVTSAMKQLDKFMPVYHQKDLRMTGLADFAAEAYMLAEDNARLTEDNTRTFLANKSLADELFETKTSLSWRITLPLRLVMRAAKFFIASISNRLSN